MRLIYLVRIASVSLPTAMYLLVCLSSSGQSVGQTNPAGVLRVNAAVELLKSSLDAMGGSEVWDNLHGAITEGIAKQDGQEDRNFIWSDDWSGRHRLRRESTGSRSVKPYLFKQNSTEQQGENAEISPSGQQLVPPRFDSISALTDHLPGAVLAIVLRDGAYTIEWYISNNLSKEQCVRINKDVHDGRTTADVIFCFAEPHAPPSSAYIIVPDALRPEIHHMERITYKGFQDIEGLSVPTEMVVERLHRKDKHLFIMAMHLNPTFSSSTFGEAAQ